MNKISIMHQNLQCLRNKKYELKILMNNELQDLDILCFTEHWLKQDEICSHQIENFNLSSSFCQSSYKTIGTAIYVKQNLKHRENTQTNYLNLEKTFKHVVTEIKFLNSSCLLIACIYRSPDGCIKPSLNILKYY